MSPLSLIYGAVSGARNLIYDTGFFSARLQAPVVSVGNISAGGTGKTPFIIYLGEQLKQRGVRFDVLSRGYGRETKGLWVVEPSGSARQFGDEPLLIARRLGVPVVIAESRYAAGMLAEHRFQSQLHLLDDGFQHRQLHRDIDIVLLPEEDLTDKLLPAGRLREPVMSLCRADVVLLESPAAFPERVRAQGTCAPTVLKLERSMTVDEASSCGVVAFCGIARPHGFFAGLRAAGVNVIAERAFRDHHAYAERDVEELTAILRNSCAAGFVTTEKDSVNLGELAHRVSPLRVARLRVSVEQPDLLLGRIMRLVVGSVQAEKP